MKNIFFSNIVCKNAVCDASLTGSVIKKFYCTCKSTIFLQKRTTCHTQFVVHRIFTVYNSTSEVANREFTSIYSGHCGSHICSVKEKVIFTVQLFGSIINKMIYYYTYKYKNQETAKKKSNINLKLDDRFLKKLFLDRE